MQLVDTYLQRSRKASTNAGLRRAGVSAERIYTHVRGADATYSKRSIDTIATYVVPPGIARAQGRPRRQPGGLRRLARLTIRPRPTSSSS